MRIVKAAGGVLAAALALLAVPGTVAAADFTVTKGADSRDGACNADCSLREAVDAANAATGFDRIVLPAGTYTLSRAGSDDTNNLGDLDPNGALELRGAGSGSTIIDAGGIDRHLDIESVAGSTDTYFVSGVTLRNGNSGIRAGGAIALEDVSLSLSDMVLAGNRAGDYGGALYVEASKVLVIATLRGVTLQDNVVMAGWGGAIASFGSTSLGLVNSSVVGNHADGTDGRAGGIVSDAGALDLENVTVSGNTTSGDGGGIHQTDSSATLTHVTIAQNAAAGRGDGLRGRDANIETRNVLVSNGGSDDCVLTGLPSITSSGNDLDAGTSCGFLGAGDRSNADAKLVPLAANAATIPDSGPTHALYAGSAAIDAAAPAPCVMADQRGITRPIGPACDIGAFEAPLNPPAEPRAAGAPPAAPVAGPGAAADRTRPTAQITINPSVFTVARGTTIRYRLSEPAGVTIAIAQKTAGLKLKGSAKRAKPRCMAATKGARTKRLAQIRRRLGKKSAGRAGRRRVATALRRSRCNFYAHRGTLRRRGATGANRLPFSGRLRGRPLKPARYRAELRATDDAGNRSPTVSARFRIVADPKKRGRR